VKWQIQQARHWYGKYSKPGTGILCYRRAAFDAGQARFLFF
jgi:hypothetical protein